MIQLEIKQCKTIIVTIREKSMCMLAVYTICVLMIL